MRKPAFAGSFYPSEQKELLSELELLFNSQQPEKYYDDAVGLIAPHAGYLYSGHVAAKIYNAISRTPKRRVVVIGVDHRGGDVIATSKQDWLTPLGPVKIDLDKILQITKEQAIVEDEFALKNEHSIEVQLPFLQYIFGGFYFTPLQLPRIGFSEIQDLAQKLADRETLFVASSDLIHFGSNYGFVPKECIYGPNEFVKGLDEKIIARIIEGDPESFYNYILDNDLTVCGVAPITLLMEISRILKAKTIEKVGYDNSFSRSHDVSSIVGYAGIAFS
jgi:hypothetical protein